MYERRNDNEEDNFERKDKMKKKMTRAFGKEIYLLGRDDKGVNYWLEEASWDCDWYWGFGYVETYTNNDYPERSRDISSHQHFDGLFLEQLSGLPESWREFFKGGTPFSDNELWTLAELMKTAYALKGVAGIYHRGGSHITKNPCKQALQNAAKAEEINQTILPAIFEAIKGILMDSNEGGNKNEQ